MSDIHVIVIGAGLAGLAIAQGLKKQGISYLVAERETAPRDRNWGVTISWSHPVLMRLLPQELYEKLNGCQPDPSLDTKKAGCESVLLRDGRTGKTLVEPPFPGIRRMQIQKTKQNWSKGLNIKFGKRLTDITVSSAGVTAHFDDGTSESGSVLIGADGGGSQVRRWLLGPLAAPLVLPYAFVNFSFQVTAEQAVYLDSQLHPIVDVGVHPDSMYMGLFVLNKPDLTKPETWTFYILATWPITTIEDEENTGDRLKRLRTRMGDDWCEPYKSAIKWVPDDVEIKKDELKIWHGKQWDNKDGKVTLAGDAAHSMTFHRGQGGNNAFNDAGEFVDAMVAVHYGKKSLKEAIDEYDEGVLSRGQTEVEISRQMTVGVNDYQKFLTSPIMTHGIQPMHKVK